MSLYDDIVREHWSCWFFYMAMRSPASSCVVLMANGKCILYAKNIKGSEMICNKNGLDFDIATECRTFQSSPF